MNRGQIFHPSAFYLAFCHPHMYVLVLFSLALEKYEGHCSQPTIIKILFVKDKRRVIRLQPYL
jgi:hypothetical protein